MGREDNIRLIAYSIWEQEGCPNGKDCEHWLKAESVWQGKQRNATASRDTEAKSEETAKRGKRDRSTSNKR